jgi:serine/threonine-protein kinase
MPFEVGQRVNDYEILSILGEGGMGRVYRVRNVISSRIEAMKVLLPDLAAAPDLANRFIGEIRMLASFDHPNIAQLRTALQVDNQLVMIMEFVEGSTLDQRAKQSPIPLQQTLDYIDQVLSALSYAHSHGVVHRDIKPSNMMVTPQGAVKVMDFGIAKSAADPNVTRPGTTLGSLYYMSPEQVRGGSVDGRSDLYSLGISLYELTAGRKPFQADTTFDILNQQLNVPPQPPIEYNPTLPPALNEIILTSLAKDPAQRFQSADAFRNALHSVRASLDAGVLPTQSAHQQNPAPAWIPAVPAPSNASAGKGNRALWMGIGALALVCVVAAAALVLPRYFKTRASSPAQTEAVHALKQTTAPAENIPSPTAAQPQQTDHSAPATGAVSSTSSGAQNKSDNATAFPTRVRESARQESHQTRERSPEAAVSAQPPVQQPPQETSQSPQSPASSNAPSQQDIDQLNDRMIQLSARANAAKSSVDRLRNEQAASGLGLRQDISASLSRMEAYMDAAERATQSGNIPSARKSMEQAEKELDKLESFLGK